MQKNLTGLCPFLTYTRARAHSYLAEFQRAQNELERQMALSRCLELAKMLQQVVAPLASMAQGPEFSREHERLAGALSALGGIDWERHESFFPADNGKQLLLDRLDDIESKLNFLCRKSHKRGASIFRFFQSKEAA